MRRHPYVRCKDCDKHRDLEGGMLSATGLCLECADLRKTENMDQLVGHDGPYFNHWRRRTLAAFGVTLPEDDRLTA
jgi:hypothetical protein